MPQKKREKKHRQVKISYGHIEDAVESMLRAFGVVDDSEDLVDIKWPLGNEDLNLCRRDTIVALQIKVIKE